MRWFSSLLCVVLLSGCGLFSSPAQSSADPTPDAVESSEPDPTGGQPINLDDPFHSFNEAMLSVNDTLDTWIAKPVAQAYVRYIPASVRSCIGNITGTLSDVNSAVNAGLQGKMFDLINGVGRILFNTSVGVGGCVDVATDNGQPALPNDFGLTLALWGVPPGPYLMLPLFGPQTLRSTVGMVVDAFISNGVYKVPLPHHVTAASITMRSLALIHQRASLLGYDNMLNSLALDRYDFLKSAYWQNRRSVVLRQLGINPAQEAPSYDDPDGDPGDPGEAYDDPGE